MPQSVQRAWRDALLDGIGALAAGLLYAEEVEAALLTLDAGRSPDVVVERLLHRIVERRRQRREGT